VSCVGKTLWQTAACVSSAPCRKERPQCGQGHRDCRPPSDSTTGLGASGTGFDASDEGVAREQGAVTEDTLTGLLAGLTPPTAPAVGTRSTLA